MSMIRWLGTCWSKCDGALGNKVVYSLCCVAHSHSTSCWVEVTAEMESEVKHVLCLDLQPWWVHFMWRELKCNLSRPNIGRMWLGITWHFWVSPDHGMWICISTLSESYAFHSQLSLSCIAACFSDSLGSRLSDVRMRMRLHRYGEGTQLKISTNESLNENKWDQCTNEWDMALR